MELNDLRSVCDPAIMCGFYISTWVHFELFEGTNYGLIIER